MTLLDVSKERDGKIHLLLAASGSVATIKIPEIARALSRHKDKLSIRIIVTEAAKQFLSGQSSEQPILASLIEIPVVEAIYEDASEWVEPWTRGAPILHIEARRWADLLVIAPLDANTLAKIVNGMSDNLLTSVVRAWDTDGMIDGKKKIIMAAPAMNTAMWEHPITAKQIKILEDDWGIKEDIREPGWFKVLRPRETKLACGDTGNGAMMEWPKIVTAIEDHLGL